MSILLHLSAGGGRSSRARRARRGAAVERGPFFLDLPVGGRVGVVRFGQSYEEGLMGFPPLSAVQAYGNERAVNASDPGAPPPSLIPLVPGAGNEELVLGYSNQLARDLPTTQVVAHVRALGGSSITDHVPATPRFAENAQLMSDAAGLVAGVLIYGAAAGNIGFSDETGNVPRADDTPVMPWATYEGHLLSILDGYRLEAAARTGQAFAFPLMIDQLGFWQLDPGVAIPAGYALEQLNLALTNPAVICAGPTHPYAVGPDNLHLAAEGYRAKAEHDGAVLALVLRGGTWRPLYALSATAVGVRVTLLYRVPAVVQGAHAGGPWLVLDTTAAAWRAPAADPVTHGFRYVPPPAGAARAVVAVTLGAELSGGLAEVHVDLDGAPEAGAQIGVADFGAAPPAAPACNLRDQWSVTTEGGQPAWNFASTQRVLIT